MGTRVLLFSTGDPHTGLKNGDGGTLLRRRQDPWGEIVDVAWDSGSSLSLVRGQDHWMEIDWNDDDPTDVHWRIFPLTEG